MCGNAKLFHPTPVNAFFLSVEEILRGIFSIPSLYPFVLLSYETKNTAAKLLPSPHIYRSDTHMRQSTSGTLRSVIKQFHSHVSHNDCKHPCIWLFCVEVQYTHTCCSSKCQVVFNHINIRINGSLVVQYFTRSAHTEKG